MGVELVVVRTIIFVKEDNYWIIRLWYEAVMFSIEVDLVFVVTEKNQSIINTYQ
jgi:hypothetical protein